MQKTIFEPHPISPERKRELRLLGYKIIDARFAPTEPCQQESGGQEAKPKPRTKLKAAAQVEAVEKDTEEGSDHADSDSGEF